MSTYNRIDAVNYARTYALHANPSFKHFDDLGAVGGDCTNFISQCLLAGGAPMIFFGKNPWWYKNNNSTDVNNHQCSLSWSLAHSLYWYLRVNEVDNLSGTKGIELSSPLMLQLGDLIFYEDTKKVIYHSAIVTSISGNQPLVSQHTFEGYNIPYIKSNKVAKYHFLRITL